MKIGQDEFDTGVVHFMEDTTVFFPHQGLHHKVCYELEGRKIIIDKVIDFHEGFDENMKGEVEFSIRNDTLFYNDIILKRSSYNSYVEHFANSKGLKIDLPESRISLPSDRNYYRNVDFFIGYNENNDVKIIINNEPAEFFDTGKRLKQLQDSIHHISSKIVFRVFADKNIDISYIHDLHTTMKRMDIKMIHYVGLNPDLNPYTDFLSGSKILIFNRILKSANDSVLIRQPFKNF
ncbi:MAG: hypothetical protein JXQ96_05150 [Cyclobacteriaceae bacterium]